MLPVRPAGTSCPSSSRIRTSYPGIGLDAEPLLRPVQRVRVAALAGEEQRAQAREVVLPDVLAAWIVALDGAEGGGRGEEGVHPVLRADAPERARVGRAHRLAFVEDAGAARTP